MPQIIAAACHGLPLFSQHGLLRVPPQPWECPVFTLPPVRREGSGHAGSNTQGHEEHKRVKSVTECTAILQGFAFSWRVGLGSIPKPDGMCEFQQFGRQRLKILS